MVQRNFISYSLHKDVMSTFHAQRSDEQFCDITLLVGTKRIHAHRLILSAVCPYFKTMFSTSFMESQQKEITLREVDGEAMELLVDYMYTAQINISHSNAENILQASHMFQLEEVKSWCCAFLKSQLDSSNCIGIAEFAGTYSCTGLQADAINFLRKKFLSVMKCEEFLLIPFSRLKDILSHETFYVSPVSEEEQLYRGLVAWVKYDVCARKQHLAELLGFVRLPLLGIEFITETVKTDSLLKEDKQCCKLVEAAQTYLNSVSARPQEKEGLFIAVRTPCCAVTNSFNLWPADWRKVPASTPPLGQIWDVAYINGRVFVTSTNPTTRLSQMNAYILATNEWIECKSHGLHPMFTRLVVCKGVMYAFGYLVKLSAKPYTPSNFKAQRYNPTTNKWRAVCTLWKAEAGSSCRAVATDEAVYIFGGRPSDAIAGYNFVERFSVSTKQCTEIAIPNLLYGAGVDVTVYKNMIYLVGRPVYSLFTQKDFRSVRCFNPEVNQITQCGKLSVPQTKTKLVVLNSKLYAVGGSSKFNSILPVEVYDETTNKWQVCEDITVPFDSGYRCAVIPLPADYARLQSWDESHKRVSRVELSQLRVKCGANVPCSDNDGERSDDYNNDNYSNYGDLSNDENFYNSSDYVGEDSDEYGDFW